MVRAGDGGGASYWSLNYDAMSSSTTRAFRGQRRQLRQLSAPTPPRNGTAVTVPMLRVTDCDADDENRRAQNMEGGNSFVAAP